MEFHIEAKPSRLRVGLAFALAAFAAITASCVDSTGRHSSSIDTACKNSDANLILSSASLLGPAESSGITLTLKVARCDRDLISEFELIGKGDAVTRFTSAAGMNSPTFETGTRDQPGYAIQDQTSTEAFGHMYREVKISSVSANGNVAGTLRLFTT